jgi:hypothetical protein
MKDVAIIVPYRNREEHLLKFAPHMNSVLSSENLSYGIFIIEQTDDKPFNRAKLLNVGYDLVAGSYKNFVFHDVDMLPITGKASYAAVESPTHYAAIVEQFGWSLAYQTYVGGVTAFDKHSFEVINGFCNEYFGWGAEDDDLFRRCESKGIKFARRNNMYSSLHHERKVERDLYDRNLSILNSWHDYTNDGLSTLSYKIVNEEQNSEYRKIKVEI